MEHIEEMDADQRAMYFHELYPSIIGVKWLYAAEELNQLKNIKVEMNSGIVSMWKDDSWHLMNVKSNFALWKMVNRKLVVDYELMQISVVKESGEVECIIDRCIFNDKYTLGGQPIIPDIHTRSSGIINEESGKLVSFPQHTYRVDDQYFNLDFIKIAKGRFIKYKPFLSSFQHVHIFAVKLSINAYLITYEPVKVDGTKIIIGSNTYHLYMDAQQESNTFLLNTVTQLKIKLTLINQIISPEIIGTTTTYGGLIVPDYKKYIYIYNIDGIWLGYAYYKFSILYPYKPNSGAITKAALVATDSE